MFVECQEWEEYIEVWRHSARLGFLRVAKDMISYDTGISMISYHFSRSHFLDPDGGHMDPTGECFLR